MLAQRKDETVFEYWISFWPTAPLFGVPWRFEAVAGPAAAFFRPTAVAAEMTRGAAQETAQAAEEAVATASPAVEPTPAELGAAAAASAVPPGNGSAPTLEADDLKQIKGVGPKVEKLLNELGVYRYEQIAEFGEKDFAWLDEHLTATLKGRPQRDDWPAQARALM